MKTENNSVDDNAYDIGLSIFTRLGESMENAGLYSGFLRIRKEMNHFLLNLSYCGQADARGQRIHFLFMALEHLDNLEKEIRTSVESEELTNTEQIHEKIGSLKILILKYIRHLTASG